MMSDYFEKESPPLTAIIYLILFALIGAIVFTTLAFVAGFIIWGNGVLTLSGTGQIGFLKLVQIASTLGIFLIPAIMYARKQSNNALVFLRLSTPLKGPLLVLGIAVIITSAPFLEWTLKINRQMDLPGFLQDLELWMKSQEDALEKLTIQLLRMETPLDFAVNLLMIAILPAIGEELIFRGCLQKIMTQWTKNYHWGIWIGAIIFSAIHLQFYGFLPRMLLGALFGYLLVWSKSIWLPIFAHFINNGTAVISAYVYQKNGQSIEKINETPYTDNVYIYFFSLLLTGLILWIFYRKSLQYQEDSNRPGEEKLG